MRKLVIATGNQHKLTEMKRLFKDVPFEIVGQNEIGEFAEVEETGTTFKENAEIKALGVSRFCDEYVLADDSGLVVDALGGEPGINSARYLGHDTSYTYKNQVIVDRLKGVTDRSARFVCAISLCKGNDVVYTVEETFEGEIIHESLGSEGFGYDPIFFYPPMNMTSAQMTMEQKNEVSHRGKAIRKIITYLLENVHED
ncbi:MAG: RdgB/HAM1 family non-canonical purine NTP pyrophosphatase [Erysipelotrichaceae bacterium]|nr:RdgB/HAM1 family non-canonical purine NTP pyrophosphatase [Erysipelotrichaceae bacterium]MBR3694286.1 RdgB/HAM1 family non-canonical purine NTP pyrophosphatase [Erysipelotrichales bacterium]